MGDGFSCIFPVIDDEAEAFAAVFDAEFVGNFPGGKEERSEGGLIVRCRFTHPWNDFFGHNEHVDGGLWGNVMEGGDKIILIDQRSWNLAINDFLEDGFFRHE